MKFWWFPVMDECQGTTALITGALVNCIPAWMRFAQCLRRFRDSKEAFPHLVNAGKYSTTFFVVIFNSLKKYNKSESINYYKCSLNLFRRRIKNCKWLKGLWYWSSACLVHALVTFVSIDPKSEFTVT